jgi:Ion channel
MELSRHRSPHHNATTRQDDVHSRDMKHLTKTSNPSGPRAQLQVYVLALLLAAFIAALHAGILFGLADLLSVLQQWAKTAMAERPADILVVIFAICVLFTAHLAETAIWATFFWKSGQLPSFADSWYFAGTSHTTLGYGDIVLRKPWSSLGPISAINGLLTFGCSTAFLFLVLQNIWQHPL